MYVNIRKEVPTITRKDIVEVVINKRNSKGEEWSKLKGNLNNITINSCDNLEIYINNNCFELPINQIVNIKVYPSSIIVFSMNMQLIFNFGGCQYYN